MLKEARIVMPLFATPASIAAHQTMRHSILDAFGGYTVTISCGVWFDGQAPVNDDVTIYDIAIEAERDASWDTLFQIAMKAGRELQQEAVYIRYPDGSVCIEPVHGREGLGGLQPTPAKVDAATAERKRREREVDELAETSTSRVKVPLGGRRLPAIGEIWETSCGDKVAVIRKFDRVIGKFDVVVLSSGPTSPFGAGLAYEVDEDGKVLPDKSSHPRDLKRFVKDF